MKLVNIASLPIKKRYSIKALQNNTLENINLDIQIPDNSSYTTVLAKDKRNWYVCCK
jgi:hypothetical protein